MADSAPKMQPMDIMLEAMAYGEICSQLMVMAVLQVNQQGKMLMPFEGVDSPFSSVAHTIIYRVVVPPEVKGEETKPAFLERVIDIGLLKRDMRNRASMLELSDDSLEDEQQEEEDDDSPEIPAHSKEARAYAEESARSAGKEQVCWQVGRNTPPERLAEFLDHIGHGLFDYWPVAVNKACREDLAYLLKPLRNAAKSENAKLAVDKARKRQQPA